MLLHSVHTDRASVEEIHAIGDFLINAFQLGLGGLKKLLRILKSQLRCFEQLLNSFLVDQVSRELADKDCLKIILRNLDAALAAVVFGISGIRVKLLIFATAPTVEEP